MVKVILTGFTPFCGSKDNPGEIILNAINNVNKIIIDVSVRDVVNKMIFIRNTIKDLDEKIVVVHLGLDANISSYVFENGANNFMDFECPDNDGIIIKNKKIDPIASKNNYIATNLPIQQITTVLQPKYCVEIRKFGGTYVSNFIYYVSLKILKKSNVYCLYVHLPPFEKIPFEQQLAFVNDLINDIRVMFSFCEVVKLD